MISFCKIDVCVPGERGVRCVTGVVVWGDDLPSDDVIVCQKIDVAFAGVSVSGEGEPVESVEGSSEDYVPSVSLALIECLKLSDGDVISHELSSLFCGILVGW